jgi:hypothetical protein
VLANRHPFAKESSNCLYVRGPTNLPAEGFEALAGDRIAAAAQLDLVAG